MNWSNSAMREGINHVKSVNIQKWTNKDFKFRFLAVAVLCSNWLKKFIFSKRSELIPIKTVDVSLLKGQLQISIYTVHIIVEVLTTTTVHNGTYIH